MPILFEKVEYSQLDVDNSIKYDYLQGNLLQKIKLFTRIRVETFIAPYVNNNPSIEEPLLWNPTTLNPDSTNPGWVIDDEELNRFANFNAGDIIEVDGISSPLNSINGDYLIVIKLNDNAIRILPIGMGGGTFPTNKDVVQEDGKIMLVQQPKGFTFDFGLIENLEPTNYFSKTDGDIMRYQLDDNAGVVNDTTWTYFTPIGRKSWQMGLDEYVRIKEHDPGGEPIPNAYFYDIEQVFYIHPLYTHPQLFDLLANLPPDYFSQLAALKHVFRIWAHRDMQDPNVYQEGIYDQKEGNTGWFDEWLNGGAANYTVDNISYSPGISFQRDKEVEINFNIKDIGVAPKYVMLFFYFLPEVPSDYQEINTTIKQNYGLDVCRYILGNASTTTADTNTSGNTLTNVASTAMLDAEMLLLSKVQVTGAGIPANTVITAFTSNTITLSNNATATAAGVTISFIWHGLNFGTGLQAITNVSMSAISGGAGVEFEANFGADAKALINKFAEKRYLIAAVTVGATQAALTANYTTVKVDVNAISLDIPDGVIDTDTQYLRHIDTGRHANTNEIIRVEEEICVDTVLDLDRSELELQLKTVEHEIICTNSSTEQTVTLENYVVDLSAAPIIGDVRFINESTPSPYNSNTAELISAYRAYRLPALDTASNYFYGFQFPFIMRWEKWTQLLLNVLPADFLDTAEPFNGYNNEWLRLAALTDWSLKYRIRTTVEVDGFEKTIINDKDIEPKTYLENPDWINETIKVFDGATELSVSGQPYFKSQKDNTIELSFEYNGALNPASIETYMVCRLIITEQGDKTSTPTWSSIYNRGNGLIAITRVGNIFTGTIFVDQSLLPIGVLEVTVSASIGMTNKINVLAEIENNNEIEALIEAQGTTILTSLIFNNNEIEAVIEAQGLVEIMTEVENNNEIESNIVVIP